jgi:hypothetical protein
MLHLCRTGVGGCATKIIVLLSAALLASCASMEVQTNYQPPQGGAIPNSIVVQQPFDVAWDNFVRKLSQSFFVVNQISKESRLINISVGGPRANEFFDCGRMKSTVNGKPWTYFVGRSSEFREDGFRSETVVDHKVVSNGTRMNIFVAPRDGGTLFEVNSTYTVAIRQTGRNDVQNLYGQVVSRKNLETMNAVFGFTTKAPSTQPFGGTDVTCRATGVWEREILDIARSG